MSISLYLPEDIIDMISSRFKSKRLLLDLTREGLFKRSGVSVSSIKRFEATGKTSFESLLKIALVLNCLDDFTDIASNKTEGLSLNELIKKKPTKKRGRIK